MFTWFYLIFLNNDLNRAHHNILIEACQYYSSCILCLRTLN